MEKFDIENYKKNRPIDGSDYIYILQNGTKIKEYSSKLSFYKTVYKKDALILEMYSYDLLGNIKIKHQSTIKGGAAIGKMYEYNSKGEVTKITDYDQIFTYNWDDIQAYCKENTIDISKAYIRHLYDKNNVYWTIQYQGKYGDKEGQITIKKDGKTGELISVIRLIGKQAVFFDGGGVGTEGVYETLYDVNEVKKNQSRIYKTYKGKSYTEAEWKVFEQQLFEIYAKKNNIIIAKKDDTSPPTNN